MPDLSTRNLAYLRQKFGPELVEALMDHQASINNLGKQTNAAPVGKIAAPPKHTALSVTGGGSLLDIKVTDAAPSYPGYTKFADVSADSSFSTFHTIPMGSSNNWRGQSPVQGKAFVRTYSQYANSDHSEHLYHASAVDTSSTAPAASQSGDTQSGFGPQPVSNVKR